jgi:hypothetical protein
MKNDDADAARSTVLREWRNISEFMRGLGCPAQPAFYDGHDFSGWPPGDGEGMLIPITIGARGNLSKAEARTGAAMWREVTKRYPKGYFVICLLGYNADPREVWEFRDARRYVRWWARFAGVDDIETADRFLGLGSAIGAFDPRFAGAGVGFLAACGVFGEEARQVALRSFKPTVQQ